MCAADIYLAIAGRGASLMRPRWRKTRAARNAIQIQSPCIDSPTSCRGGGGSKPPSFLKRDRLIGTRTAARFRGGGGSKSFQFTRRSE